ncbi:MAG TPA: hypothetical protein VHE09_13795 [Rhizomicrobium sp.]|jgi:hypothetical protein|nr:hypothetical protein [Rhizomicrobium sp.]
MRFLFDKLREGKYDRLRIERADGVEEISCPKIGGIPHDMVHFAVEKVMQGDGFLRRVANGEQLSFRMASNVTSDQMERLVEVMQADAISGYPAASDLIDMYRVTCDAREVTPYPVSENDIAALREEMARLSQLWAATPAGSTLALEFEQ